MGSTFGLRCFHYSPKFCAHSFICTLNMSATYKLVLLRHGESEWNKENKFTGWYDCDLSEKGEKEAHDAAQSLLKGGYTFDIFFTSVLKRAIRTLNIVQEDMDLLWVDVVRSWRLNERMYGALQGLNKSETAQKHGEDPTTSRRLQLRKIMNIFLEEIEDMQTSQP